jgi:hypothetical protein
MKIVCVFFPLNESCPQLNETPGAFRGDHSVNAFQEEIVGWLTELSDAEPFPCLRGKLTQRKWPLVRAQDREFQILSIRFLSFSALWD